MARFMRSRNHPTRREQIKQRAKGRVCAEFDNKAAHKKQIAELTADKQKLKAEIETFSDFDQELAATNLVLNKANKKLEAELAKYEEIETDLNLTIGMQQEGIRQWKAENKKLEGRVFSLETHRNRQIFCHKEHVFYSIDEIPTCPYCKKEGGQ